MDRPQLIQKLTNGSERSWVKAGSLANTADRIQGDVKYMFSKTDMKFSIWVCNYILKWERKEIYSWSLKYDIDTKFTLLIDGKPCSFSFDRTLKYLTLKLPNWQSAVTLQ